MSVLANYHAMNINASEIDDYGIITLMYHRFDESKYPSTNIMINEFESHLDSINKDGFTFISADDFINNFSSTHSQKKVLLTIDDGFTSFYESAWPILQKNKIPFILFVNTREVGSNGYMNWDQIKEIAKEEFVHIGNHGHSHEYLADMNKAEVVNDIKIASDLFEKELGYNSPFFSYPFGEYSLETKSVVNEFGFKFAFGQHSGVIDSTKDPLELPRFPINEKYGEQKRFEQLLRTLPFKFKNIVPEEKYLDEQNNPPKVLIEFYENINNLKNITCYSNEENKWRQTKANFIDDNNLELLLEGKFITERGRINCSLNAGNGYWRWLGMQFVIAKIKD